MMAQVLTGISKAKLNDKVPTDSYNDFNFILGDMNWRILRSFDQQHKVVNDSPKEIFNIDELKKMFKQRKFYGYQEQAITFLPTYKREHGHNEYINKK